MNRQRTGADGDTFPTFIASLLVLVPPLVLSSRLMLYKFNNLSVKVQRIESFFLLYLICKLTLSAYAHTHGIDFSCYNLN